MKLLLINTIKKSRGIETSFPHLGFAYIASYLEKFLADSCEIKIIDDDIEQTIRTFQPDVVGVSSVSQNFNLAKRICALTKGIGICTIVGGIHISMLPESLDENMDCGVIGEGEQTLVDIAREFQEHGELTPDVLAQIPGVVFRDENKMISTTTARPVIKPLDTLPMPKRELLSVVSRDTTSMFSSRGCPYNCVFCASTRFWPGVRLFSAEYVINELQEVVEHYHPECISFKDDLFIANKDRLGKIVEYVNKEGLNKRVRFFVSCRANLVDRETAGLLKKMNVVHASMGLESGCSRVLNYLKGPTVMPEQGLDAISYLADEKIHVNASFIIGSPDESKDEILQTLDFIKRSRLSSFQTYVMTPFPGTPVWDYATEKGLTSKDMDWDKLTIDFADDYSNKIVVSEILSREELYEFYMLFRKEERKRYTSARIRRVIRNPLLIANYIRKKALGRNEI